MPCILLSPLPILRWLGGPCAEQKVEGDCARWACCGGGTAGARHMAHHHSQPGQSAGRQVSFVHHTYALSFCMVHVCSCQMSPVTRLFSGHDAPLSAAGAHPLLLASSHSPLSCCRDHDKLALQHTMAAGWGVLDAWAITSPLVQLPRVVRPLWDPRHFTGARARSSCSSLGSARQPTQQACLVRCLQPRQLLWPQALPASREKENVCAPRTTPSTLCSCGVSRAEPVPAQHDLPTAGGITCCQLTTA